MTFIHQKENKKYSGDNRCLYVLHTMGAHFSQIWKTIML